MAKYLVVILLTLLLISCSKNDNITRIPEACFYADRITILRSDTVIFTNCSKADNVFLDIVRRNEVASNFNYSFDKSNIIFKEFNDTGQFDAVISASYYDNGSPIKQQRIPISVR
jgi:hypothetical protein